MFKIFSCRFSVFKNNHLTKEKINEEKEGINKEQSDINKMGNWYIVEIRKLQNRMFSEVDKNPLLSVIKENKTNIWRMY